MYPIFKQLAPVVSKENGSNIPQLNLGGILRCLPEVTRFPSKSGKSEKSFAFFFTFLLM